MELEGIMMQGKGRAAWLGWKGRGGKERVWKGCMTERRGKGRGGREGEEGLHE